MPSPIWDWLTSVTACGSYYAAAICASTAAKPLGSSTTIAMVKAPAQAAYMDKILPLLTEGELGCYRRGKNAHVHAVPKGATPAEYAKATGLETLFGALFLAGKTDRANQLFKAAVEDHADL